jgi:purine-binding chemotaxis protein CheW
MEELMMNEIEGDKYLTFAIGDDAYGIEIEFVDDIIGVQNITYVPRQPEFIKGVINLRGLIIPVIDIRIRFNEETRAYDDRTCIVVIKIDDMPVGIVVDRVLEVVEISEITVPSSFSEANKNFMTGIGKLQDKIVLLVDCKALLEDIVV